MIEVEHLRKTYGDRVAVDDVSFEVGRGEIFGVLGPNGAGKTTTVESIAGLRVGDSGSVRIDGVDPWTDRPATTRLLGVQLQESRLQPKITVGEALALFSSFYDDPTPWRGLAERLGLDPHLGQRFADLSGGQQQRLAIALALVGRPQVVVLDELTTGLDPRARRDTWTLVREVRDSGVTVLLVTHSMEEAERLCDRVAIIADGRVRALDTPAGLAHGGGSEPGARGRVQLTFELPPDAPPGLVSRLRGLPGTGQPEPYGDSNRDSDGGGDSDGDGDHSVVLRGDDDTVLAALDVLRDLGVRPRRLRVTDAAPGAAGAGSLDEAYLRLTGATPGEDDR